MNTRVRPDLGHVRSRVHDLLTFLVQLDACVTLDGYLFRTVRTLDVAYRKRDPLVLILLWLCHGPSMNLSIIVTSRSCQTRRPPRLTLSNPSARIRMLTRRMPITW